MLSLYNSLIPGDFIVIINDTRTMTVTISTVVVATSSAVTAVRGQFLPLTSFVGRIIGFAPSSLKVKSYACLMDMI